MQPPLLAKPLWADGRDGAHGLAVIHEALPLPSHCLTFKCLALPPYSCEVQYPEDDQSSSIASFIFHWKGVLKGRF
jgi:hypothetical protein